MEKGWVFEVHDKEFGIPADLIEPLTRREEEILALLEAKLSNQEIADRLFLALNTVKWHARQIYAKLGVKNRQQAVLRARDLGLLRAVRKQSSLPRPLTPFIGREEELAQIQQILAQPETRLLTLTGLGGIGKTRLAIESAARCAGDPGSIFRDGVFFVPLAARTHPEEILPAIAETLQYSPYEGEKGVREQIIAFLAHKKALLVLDNCEHLTGGAGEVGEILSDAIGVKVLTTARQPLGLQVEIVLALSGLPFPLENESSRAEHYPAVKLFCSRARHADPAFTPQDGHLEGILRICRITQGIPLALELAAAWVNLLTCAEIATEIERSLDILSMNMGDLPERQRSIRAVFDRSWEQLSQQEKDVLMRLTVFSGGFTRDAAEGVADAALAVLSGLVRKSLLSHDPGQRFEIHELIRQYAREKLEASGSLEAALACHAAYFADRLQHLETSLKGRGQADALKAIGGDLDNIRAAWNWAVDRRDARTIAQMLESLYLYCIFRRGSMDSERMFRLGRDAFTGHRDPAARGLLERLTVRYEMLIIDLIRTSDLEAMQRAASSIEKTLKAIQPDGSPAEIGFCLYALGRTAMWSQELPRAIALFEQAMASFQQAGDLFYHAYTLQRIGFCCFLQGDLRQSLEYQHRCLAIARPQGNHYVAAWSLHMLADIVFALGRIDESGHYRQEALERHTMLGDSQGIVWAKSYLALIQHYLGNVQDAERLAREAGDLSRELNHPPTNGLALAVQSRILARKGDMRASKRLAEQALSLFGTNFTNTAIAKFSLAYAACLDGDLDTARDSIRYAVQSWNRFGVVNSIINCLPVLGVILLREEQPERAAQILSLALHHPRRMAAWLENDRIVDGLQTRLQQTLSKEAFSLAWQQGQELELEDVIGQILQKEI